MLGLFIGMLLVIAGVIATITYFSKKEGFENPMYKYSPLTALSENNVAELLPEHKGVDPEDLLPVDKADEDFKKSNPFAEGELQNKDFLEIGRPETVMSEALKNSVLDIRGVPAIERKQISPWNNSVKSNFISQSIGDHI